MGWLLKVKVYLIAILIKMRFVILETHKFFFMKKAIYGCLLSAPLFVLSFCSSSSGKDATQFSKETRLKPSNGTSGHVAVLELFTSQGCSSCPPADKLVSNYISKENIFVLSFHVDYWNRLGWRDPFSSKEYSQRQENYSKFLKAGIYTPQLVINGQTEMIGSDESKISNTLRKVQAEPRVAELSIKKLTSANGTININFIASGNDAGAVLNIALVEKKITTDIKAGENSGVQLTNYNVVRNFKTISQLRNGSNTSDINIPPGIDANNISVVLFIQNKDNGISAATEAGL